MIKKSLAFIYFISIMLITFCIVMPNIALAEGSYGADTSSEHYKTNINPFHKEGYDGECTWFAWGRAREVCGVSLSWGDGTHLGHARDWYANASAAGYSVGSVPRANSIGVMNIGSYGHVVFIEAVVGDTLYCSEYNWPCDLYGNYDPAGQYSDHKYHEMTRNKTAITQFIYLSSFKHNIDLIETGDDWIRLAGWIYNQYNVTKSVQIHVYVDAPAISPLGFAIDANISRYDVDAAFHVGEFHGFDYTIHGIPSGTHTLYLYAVDQHLGINAILGADHIKEVYVKKAGSVMTTTSDRVIPNGDYIIANTGMNNKRELLYMDIPGTNQSYTYTTTPVKTYCSTEGDVAICDIWTVTYDSSRKYYKIKQKGTNMALTVDETQPMLASALITVSEFTESDCQYWKISENSRDGYLVQAYCSGFALNVNGGGCTLGTDICQWEINEYPAESWVFIPYNPSQPVEDGRYYLFSNLEEDIVLDFAENDNIQIWNANETSHNNAFDFTKLSNGYYKIKHVVTGKCLEVGDGLSTYGANVRLFEDNGTIAQQWAIRQNDNGYLLTSKCNGYVLDVDNANTSNGTNVQTYPNHGSSRATWRIISEQVATSYIITYDANGGENPPAIETVFGGSTILSSQIPTRSGYNFLGWSTSQGATEAMYQPGDTYSGGTIMLYAVWCIKSFTIVFDSDGAGQYDPLAVDYGETLGELPEPSKSGLYFTGWYDEVGNQVSEETVVISNLYLIAHWSTPTKMVLPSTTTIIEAEAFEGVKTNTFIVPNSVTSIGSRAFANNNNLNTVVVYSQTVITEVDAFDGCPNLTIYGYKDSPIYYYAMVKKIPFIAIGGWMPYSDLPVGANILEEKWTYTETKKTTETIMAGWEQVGTDWQEIKSGVWSYALYPSGFDHNHVLFSAHEKAVLSEAETTSFRRTVSDISINSFIFWHWAYTDAAYVNEEINDFEGTDGRYEYHLFHAFETSDSLDEHREGMTASGIPKAFDNIWSTWNDSYSQYHSLSGPWWWWRLTVYKQNYTEYEKVNIFTRQSESTTEIQPGNGITNVEHLVKIGF